MPPPNRLGLRRDRWLRRNVVHRQWPRQTSACFGRRHFHQAKFDQRGRQDESGRGKSGFRKLSLRTVWTGENCRKLQTNRYAKTSFLQLREDAFESLGGLRWFLPLQAVSPLSKESTVAFSLARLLDDQNRRHS